jgi:uncharacterized membrane protein SpoIIM required for sporulation
VDVDAYVTAHRAEWDRLDALVSRRRRLSGDEADELVSLYQRTATHLSVIRSSSPDPTLVARLSTLVARARSSVAGSPAPSWRDLARFFSVVYPAALYRSMRWWVSAGVAFCLVSLALAAWVATHPSVQGKLLPPEAVRQLVDHDVVDYYSSAPAGSFALQVATNNALVTALCLVSGVLIVPVVFLLWQNASNVGVIGGFMAANDKTGLFFGLILPHGLLELTCVFIAAGAGLRLGWSWVDPGPRTRSEAMAREGLAVVALALGLAATLLVSGVIEAFVTPSPLPTWARIGIGLVVWLAFLTYIVVLGGRAVRAGETGGLASDQDSDRRPVAG